MRIVSLLPAATEIVALLGATDGLVGITHECDYPAVIRSRARVTRSAVAYPDDPAGIDAAVRAHTEEGFALFEMDERMIHALHPDVLLTQKLCDVCAVRETDVRALARRLSPAPRVVTLGGMSVDGIYRDIIEVAQALGVQSESQELLAGLENRVTVVHETLKAAKAPRPRVAVIEWTSPVYVAGHWGPEQVIRAGGTDVVGIPGMHSVAVPMERLVEADPEIVLFAPCGYSLDRARAEASRLLNDPEWSWLEGRQVWALDANALVSRPGPRVVDGIETMARIFNPGLFSAIDPNHAVRIQ